jgi:hypothetical protein
VYDAVDWSKEYVEDSFAIYPTGLRAEEVIRPERRTTATEQVFVDNDEICFMILEQEDDDIWGYTLKCYLENKTEQSLIFSWDDVSVNGYMIDPFWAGGVAPGMRSYREISFAASDFEENDISEVEEIEFTLRAYDSDDWFADDVFKETMTYNP